MKRLFICFAAVLPVLLSSCQKENTGNPEPEPDFVQLETGNYWIYSFYKVDTNGVETLLPETDSAYISGDTLINGNRYFIKITGNIPLKGSEAMPTYSQKTFLRDSSGCLVNEVGFILFARDNFSNVIRTDTIDGLFWFEYRMTGKDSLVQVPAGSFTTRTMAVTYYPLDPNYPWGVRRMINVYGEGVGMIKYTYAFASHPSYYEARLLRYFVNPATNK